MAKAIFKVLLKFIKSIVDTILAPVNLLVVGLFPDLTNLLSTFNIAVSSVLGRGIGYFASILPPGTKTFILLYLGILVSYYTVSIAAHAILKIIAIIRRVKIW